MTILNDLSAFGDHEAVLEFFRHLEKYRGPVVNQKKGGGQSSWGD